MRKLASVIVSFRKRLAFITVYLGKFASVETKNLIRGSFFRLPMPEGALKLNRALVLKKPLVRMVYPKMVLLFNHIFTLSRV
jgi:hypothetical protein